MVKPGVTLEDMARELNRSFLGVACRLQLMGIVILPSPGHYYGMEWAYRVRISTLQYRYKQTKKICFDVVSFMEENWERMGWKRSDHVFYLPEEMRRTPVKEGKFNPSWTNRTEPERRKRKLEEDAEKRQATKERRERERRSAISMRQSYPKYKKDGTLDRRYIGQK